MRAYEEYKESGYDWLGKIPAHWRKTKLRELTKESNERRGQRQDLELLSVYREFGVIIKNSRDDNHNSESEDTSNYKYVNKDYLVINKMKLWQGSLGISEFEGIVSPAYIVCKITKEINTRYLNYLLRSPLFKTYYNRISYGIRVGQWDSDYDDLKQLDLFLPPREEQDAIVRFLDAKCAKIDRLIKLKERQIELLNEKKQNIINQAVTKGLDPHAPMKDSGVDYIGVIPAHWQVILNHRLWEEETRDYSVPETVLSLSQQDGVIPYEDMTERSLHTSSYENWKLVLPGDLVVNRFKAPLGVFFSSAYRGIVTFHYGVFKFKLEGVTKYYEYLYHTPEACRIYASLSNGMTVGLQNLSNSHFYSAYSVYPPVHEQKDIVERVEAIHAAYRGKTKIIEKEISTLQEYKTRIISDVVTGKIAVANS